MPPPSGALDQDRWLGLWQRLEAQGSGHPEFARLVTAYSEPGRSYHTAEHINDCLSQLDLARHHATRPDEVEAALWFHDAVYLPGGADNEEQSAGFAAATLEAGEVSGDVVGRIQRFILATRHVAIPTDPGEQLVCDIDLSILGREPRDFDRFEQRIREEYDWVPEPVYRASRAEILAGFLRRRAIYQTDFFRDRYEPQARANLERLIRQLGRP